MHLLKTSIATGAFALALAASSYRLEEREAVHRTFSNDTTIDVDEVNGWISVVGDSGNTIRVDAEKVIRADNTEQMALGKREVVLDMNEKNGVAQLFVNGPFRDNNHSSENHGFHEHNDRHYDVAYNFTIHVPRATMLRLRTVNGKIEAADTAGTFDIHTINGALKMSNVEGHGSAETLNGDTTITFRKNPEGDSFFKSFNGKVDVGLLPGLSARLQLKTFNGSAYTDFDATALASSAGKMERKDGKFVFKSDRSSSLQVGSGGTELKFETFNGNIQIRKLDR
jgi:hypothetical protein